MEQNRENRVRRPSNAFIVYSNAHRKRVANENIDVDNREVSRILGRLWREMSRDDQYPYWRTSFDIQRRHRHENPGYTYSPVEARKRKEELKRQRLMRLIGEQISDETQVNQTDNKSKTVVLLAVDKPPNRVFHEIPSIPETEQTQIGSNRNNGSVFPFNSSLINEQIFRRLNAQMQTFVTRMANDVNRNHVSSAITGRDGQQMAFRNQND